MASKIMRKQTIIICLIIMICTLSIAGSLAYLHKTTDPVVNTFTVGKVSITLDEQEFDDGKPTGNRGTRGNTYDIIPGEKYVKDPIVHVKANSADCYVRVFITVDNYKAIKTAFLPTYCSTFIINPDSEEKNIFVSRFAKHFMDIGESWQFASYFIDSDKDTCTVEYRYVNSATEDKVLRSDIDQDIKVFEHFSIPTWIGYDELDALSDKLTVSIVGNAIQADTFSSAADAWAKF